MSSLSEVVEKKVVLPLPRSVNSNVSAQLLDKSVIEQREHIP